MMLITFRQIERDLWEVGIESEILKPMAVSAYGCDISLGEVLTPQKNKMIELIESDMKDGHTIGYKVEAWMTREVV